MLKDNGEDNASTSLHSFVTLITVNMAQHIMKKRYVWHGLTRFYRLNSRMKRDQVRHLNLLLDALLESPVHERGVLMHI